MDLSPIISAIAKSESIAVLVLIIVVIYQFKSMMTSREEDRKEREKSELRFIENQARNNIVMDKVADALVEMRITLASKGFQNDRS